MHRRNGADSELIPATIPSKELSEVGRIVGDEREVVGDNPAHEIPIGFAAKAKPDDMMALVSMVGRNFCKRRVQAFIDQESHWAASAPMISL